MTESRKIFVSPHIDEIRKNLHLPEQVYIFDTTLRDGEQTPGISFTLQEKITIAQQLEKLGVDIIEAGMPVVSKGDYEACKQISKLGLKCEIIGLARADRLDIDKVIECDMNSIHVFIATSDLHLKDKLKMTREEVLSAITHEVEYAKAHFSTVEFSAEDATRTSLDYLIQANKAPGLIFPIPWGRLPRLATLILFTRSVRFCPNLCVLAVIAITISGSPRQTRWLGLSRARRKPIRPLSALANELGTPRWKKWSCPSMLCMV
jgi:hypothetical protein